MNAKSTVGPKGQITIPKEFRERYHLMQGEEVVLSAQDEGVLVRHRPTSLRGILKGRLAMEGIEEEIGGMRSEWVLEKRVGRRP